MLALTPSKISRVRSYVEKRGDDWPRFSHKMYYNQRLAGRLDDVGHEDLAKKLAACKIREVMWFCTKCGESEYRQQSCKQRFCSFCQVPRQIELQKRVSALTQALKNPKLLTLTMPRSRNIEEGVTTLRTAWKKFLRSAPIRIRLKGGCYAIEAVPKSDGWHVHIHAIVDMEFTPKNILWNAWGEALDHPSPNLDIRKIEGRKGLMEALKYTTKQTDLARMSNAQIEEYVTVMRGKRLFSTFGSWFNPQWDEFLEAAILEPLECHACKEKGTMIPITIAPYIYHDDWHLFEHIITKKGPPERYVFDNEEDFVQPVLSLDNNSLNS